MHVYPECNVQVAYGTKGTEWCIDCNDRKSPHQIEADKQLKAQQIRNYRIMRVSPDVCDEFERLNALVTSLLERVAALENRK